MEMGIGCCCAVDPLFIDIRRLTEIVGPLVSDTTLPAYSQAWTYDGSAQRYEAPLAGTLVAMGSVFRYQPMRHKVTALYAIDARRTIAAQNTSIHLGITAGGIPAASHCSPLTLSRIFLPLLFLWRESAPEFSGTAIADFVRVLVNGVDVSGVQPVSTALNSVSTNGNPLWGNAAPVQIDLPTPITIEPTDVIEWDIWTSINIRSTGSSTTGGFINHPHFVTTHDFMRSNAYGADYPRFPFRAQSASNANAKLRSRSRWRLTLSADDGYRFGGTSDTLDLVPQDGWSCTEPGGPLGGNIYMQHLTFGDKIRFRWDREIPDVEIFVPGVLGGPFGAYLYQPRTIRFQPFGSAYQPWEYAQHGTWNPRGNSTFSLQGILSTTSQPGNINAWMTPALAGGNRAEGLPASMTVSKL